MENGNEFQEIERGFCSKNNNIQNPLSIYTQVSQIWRTKCISEPHFSSVWQNFQGKSLLTQQLRAEIEELPSPAPKQAVYCENASFYNGEYERLENHFAKHLEDFVPNISKNNHVSQFSYRYFILGELNPSMSPKFQISEFPV